VKFARVFLEIGAYVQTDRQIDTLIAIFRSSTGDTAMDETNLRTDTVALCLL